MEKAQDRLDVLKKIEELEKQGIFDIDVEEDPPSYELLPEQVDYLNKKLSSKIKTFFANKFGSKFFENMIKNNQLIIKEVKGLENLNSLKGGVIFTCNHFNIYDNYAVFKALKPYLKRKMLWKVIREGNYTNSPKPFDFVFQNCNTLPLSSNSQTMRKFIVAFKELLNRKENILIYPEQAMWWNYKKPRPLKSGAFNFAASCRAPIVPIFITMTDSEHLELTGFNVQELTINILSPIYPREDLSKQENIEYLKNENYNAWVKVYEEFYGRKLEYLK